jgi:hypothetical protein
MWHEYPIFDWDYKYTEHVLYNIFIFKPVTLSNRRTAGPLEFSYKHTLNPLAVWCWWPDFNLGGGSLFVICVEKYDVRLAGLHAYI